MRVAVLIALLSSAIQAALAQPRAGTFTGIVTRDTLEHIVAGAEVRLPELARTVRTDARGAFRFADLPNGRYAVIVRAIGFDLFTSTIEIVGDRTLDADLTLTPAAILLDTIRSVGTKYPAVSWMMQEFESRRHTAATGQFLGDSALRAREDDMMASLVGMLNGARLVDAGTSTFLGSARGGGSGGPVFQSGGGSTCLVSVYVDGIMVFPGGGGPPDFGRMRVSDYAGVEYYASPAEVPAQYTRTGTGCGVVLLWRRSP